MPILSHQVLLGQVASSILRYLCSVLSCSASGKEEEGPAQGYGGGSGVPLSDNENGGAETRS